MKVTPTHISIRELAEGFFDDEENGVAAYDERLNVRPAYQREFIYPDSARNEVMRSVVEGMPLNVFYWMACPDDSEFEYELLDGQQRTMSICQYVDGSYSIPNDPQFPGESFDNLPADIKKRILDYEILVYVCEGTESERLRWFERINIAGELLNTQELLNAVYSGAWVSDARRYFSKVNGPAIQMAQDHLKTTIKVGPRSVDKIDGVNRQSYLAQALKWAADAEDMTVSQYMSKHAKDKSASALWNEFKRTIRWVKKTFITTYADMKGIDWGRLWREHKNDDKYHIRDGSVLDWDVSGIDAEIKRLRNDPDISNKNIYEFVLTGDERLLSFRAFDERDQLEVYEEQGHKCPYCIEAAIINGKSADDVEELPISKMHADHIKPWSKGGRTVKENLQMLCIKHNLAKSNKE